MILRTAYSLLFILLLSTTEAYNTTRSDCGALEAGFYFGSADPIARLELEVINDSTASLRMFLVIFDVSEEGEMINIRRLFFQVQFLGYSVKSCDVEFFRPEGPFSVKMITFGLDDTRRFDSIESMFEFIRSRLPEEIAGIIPSELKGKLSSTSSDLVVMDLLPLTKIGGSYDWPVELNAMAVADQWTLSSEDVRRMREPFDTIPNSAAGPKLWFR